MTMRRARLVSRSRGVSVEVIAVYHTQANATWPDDYLVTILLQE